MINCYMHPTEAIVVGAAFLNGKVERWIRVVRIGKAGERTCGRTYVTQTLPVSLDQLQPSQLQFSKQTRIMADLTLKLRGAEVTEPKTVDEKYFVVLRNYVRGTEISARDAAENTDHLTPSPKHPVDGKTDPEEHLFAFWNALFDIASQIPAVDEDKHGRLVALVRQLTELSSGTVTIWVCLLPA